MSDYLQSLRDRQNSSLRRVGHLLERVFFYHEDRRLMKVHGTWLQYWHLLKTENTLCTYFLLNAPAITQKCQKLLLYDEELIEGRTQFGKPDLLFEDGRGGVTCVEVKQPGSGNNANKKRHKVREQVANYQSKICSLCQLPSSAVHGIVFTDDIMLQTDGPAPLGQTGLSYEGIYEDAGIIYPWVEEWFARPVMETRLKTLLLKLHLSPGDIVERALAKPSWEPGRVSFFLLWEALYQDLMKEIPDYRAEGDFMQENMTNNG